MTLQQFSTTILPCEKLTIHTSITWNFLCF